MDEDSTCHDEEAHFAVVKNSCPGPVRGYLPSSKIS